MKAKVLLYAKWEKDYWKIRICIEISTKFIKQILLYKDCDLTTLEESSST